MQDNLISEKSIPSLQLIKWKGEIKSNYNIQGITFFLFYKAVSNV